MKKKVVRSSAVVKKQAKGATALMQDQGDVKKGRLVVKILFWLGMFPAIIVIGGLKVNWNHLNEKVTAITQKPVENIIVKGEFDYLNKNELQNKISQALNGDFVNLDLPKLKEQIESDPWVYAINLKRVWPSSLHIDVVEQKPIARWGNEGFLNQYGELVLTPIDSSVYHLPELVGNKDLSEKIAKMYLELANVLSKYNLKIKQLRVDRTYSWEIVLRSGPKLMLGQRDMLHKLNNFLLVYQQHLKAHFERVEKMDLRYENGLAVQWRN